MISKVQNFLNVDRNVILSMLNSIWSLVKTPILLLLITNKLNPVEQGYWYTFLSLGALSVFAEMGFTTIITQFLSYEFAHLTLNEKNQIQGENSQIEKFISLAHYTIKRYLFIIPMGISFILLIGFIFFKKDLYNSEILFCWIFYAFTGGTALFLSLLTSVIKGINKVKEALKILFIINLLSTATLCVSLLLGLGLWSLSISAIVTFIVSLLVIYGQFKAFFGQILKFKINRIYNWKKEISSLQIQYSVSWIAGYFIFSFIVPVTMYFLDAVEAGKVGITISLGAALLQMAHSWVANKMPELNMYISLNKGNEAKNVFQRNNKSSLSFFILASIFIIVFFYFDVFAIFGFTSFASKFISLFGIILILIAEFFKLLLGNWAVFLRAYKQEPYLKITVVNAICTIAVFCIAMGVYKSLLTSLILFAIIQILSAIFGNNIFSKKIN